MRISTKSLAMMVRLVFHIMRLISVFKRDPVDFNQMLPLMMKQQMKSFIPHDFYGTSDIMKDAIKQSSGCLESKKDEAILKDFDIDIDEFDSKIIDNPYDYIEPNFFLVRNKPFLFHFN